MERPAQTGPPPSRAVFLLPALFTVANMFLGYYAVVKSFQGQPGMAAVLVLVAAVLDKLDGFVARATGTASDFGRELDSLADVVTFGVAPALLAFTWGLEQSGRLGWAVAFLFLTCGALRLARYNVQSGATDRRFFVGLPIPMGAAVLVTVVLAHDEVHPGQPLQQPVLVWAFLALVAATALLMVSSFRYFAFKDVQFGRHLRLLVVLASVLVIVAIAAWPHVVLPVLALGYAAHGPLMRFLPWRPRTVPADAPERAQ